MTMTRSSYISSLVNPIAMREVDNIDVAIRAYDIKSMKDLANGKFRLLDKI